MYADEPGNHDVAVYGANSGQIRFGTSGRAVLSAMSACYLYREDLTAGG